MQVARRESKYLISLIQFKKLETRLSLTLNPDISAGTDGAYSVRSLYFDSHFDGDYNDVLQGAPIRKKIRLRVYPPKGRIIKLEYKFKNGMDQQKSSLLLSRQQALEMMDCRYGFLTGLADPKAPVFYHALTAGAYSPKLLIEYDRQAFTAPGNGIRVTFDTHIRASIRTADLFAARVNYTPLTAADIGVLEIKYDGFLYSYVQDILRGVDSPPAAMSKYVLGRMRLL